MTKKEEYIKQLETKTTGISIENARKLVKLINDNADVIFQAPDKSKEEEVNAKFQQLADDVLVMLSESGVSLDYATYAFELIGGFLIGFKGQIDRTLSDKKSEILSLALGHKEDIYNEATDSVTSELRAEYAPIGKYFEALDRLKKETQ